MKNILKYGIVGVFALAALPAMAEDTSVTDQKIEVLQQQLAALQKQLEAMKATQTAAVQEAKAAAEDAKEAKIAALAPAAGPHTAAAPDTSTGGVQNRNIKLTFGGFTEAAGIYRTRNESADIPSSFSSGIPYPYQAGYHIGEFRGTARQSRLSLLAQGDVDANTKLASYMEFDFLGAANTANSIESNSYTPRLRQFYATADWNDIGWHVLGGQAWSLLTLNKQGITPRQEDVPLTIDAQYVPGFTWTRNTQIRVVKDIGSNVWAGLSAESPQANINAGPNVSSTCTNSSCFTNTGGSGFTTATTYTTDISPDMIAKLAFEPGWGHYEVYGVARTFHDRANNDNSTEWGGGVGLGAIVPIVPKMLDFQISGLYGNGIGRYGSAQLPDATIKPDGSIATLRELEAMAGLIAHPDEKWDLYAYTGTERVSREAYGTAFGYGNLHYDNSQCDAQGGSATHCVANTSSVWQVTAGAWYNFYHGTYGTMKAGLQDSYTERNIFGGTGGGPSTNDNITMVSFRYYPF